MLQRWANQQVGLRYRRNNLLWMFEEGNGRNTHVEFHPNGENCTETAQRYRKILEFTADDKDGHTQNNQKDTRLNGLYHKTLTQRRRKNAGEESARSVSWLLTIAEFSEFGSWLRYVSFSLMFLPHVISFSEKILCSLVIPRLTVSNVEAQGT